MNELEKRNENRSFMKGTYDDSRLDKTKELNESMTIQTTERDSYESKIHNLGGNN